MKTLYRNFLSIFRRFPASIVMNVVGLALALAAFIIIMMETYYEQTYNSSLKNIDRIFFLYEQREGSVPSSLIARPDIEHFKTISPDIVHSVYYEPTWWLAATTPDNEVHIETVSSGVEPGFFSMFGFDWIDCDTTTFDDFLYIYIPESMALKYFNRTDLVGTFLKLDHNDYGWTIGGVYRDFPENCSIKNIVYNLMGNAYKDERINLSLNGLLELKHPEDKDKVEKLLNENGGAKPDATLSLTPFSEVVYQKDLKLHNETVKLNHHQRYVYSAIALLIILIAAINFTNFYTALAPLRIRSLNTQRVLGAKRRQLVRALMTESVVLGLIAFVLALLIVKAAEDSLVNDLLKVDISITAFPGIIVATAAITILITLAASLFPALYSTSFAPAIVLKGSFGLSPRGKRLRNLLMGAQLTVAIGLLIAVGGIVSQNYYMQYSDLGYDQDRIVTINLYAAKIYENKADALAEELRKVACVEDVALSRFQLSAQEQTNFMHWGRPSEDGSNLFFICLPVSPNYLKVMGIKLIEGEDFNPKDHNAPMIFNKAAYDRYPTSIRVGKTIEGNHIVGICEDFKVSSLRDEVTPLCLKVMNGPYADWPSKGIANIRIKDGIALEDAFGPIQKACTAFAPESTFELKTQFQLMENIYTEEKHTQQNIMIYSILAVIISLSGVFSMTLFECNYRRKEIGLRKIMGASTHSIIMMFFRQYAAILLLSFIVAAPLGWYGVHRYLEGFAYKTPQHWWIYVLSFLTISVITLTTVYAQCRKTAKENPINAIRTE